MLTSPVPAPGPGVPQFVGIQLTALRVLHRRFRFVVLQRERFGLEVVRLVPRG